MPLKALKSRSPRREPTRWRRRKDARPNEILDAAFEVFSRRGFEAARMDDIARKAGVSKGTIYLYFDSKEAVFKALLRHVIAARIGELAAFAGQAQGPTAPLLAAVLRRMGAVVGTGSLAVLPKIVIGEAGNFPDLAKFYREEVIEHGMSFLGRLIERGQTSGEFRKLPVEHAVRLTIAPMLVIAIWRTTFAQFDAAPYDYDGLIEAHIQTLLKGLAP